MLDPVIGASGIANGLTAIAPIADGLTALAPIADGLTAVAPISALTAPVTALASGERP